MMDGEDMYETSSSLDNFEDIDNALDDVNLSVSIPFFQTVPPLAPLPRREHTRSTRNRSRDESLSTPSATKSLSRKLDKTNQRDISASNVVVGAAASCSDLPSTSKRKRLIHSSSSSNELIYKHSEKKSCTNISNHRVSFVLKNNADYGPGAASTSTSNLNTGVNVQTSNVSLNARPSVHDRATDTEAKGPRAIINPLAEPMWLAARKHRIAEQKASLRHDHLLRLLTDDVIPIEFLGAELLHRYYANQEGHISTALKTLIERHAREKVELVIAELLAITNTERKRAEYYTDLTQQIYAHEEDTSFASSQEGLTRVLSFFKKSEEARLETLAIKERGRQPRTELELTDLICLPVQRPPRESSGTRSRKRARNSNPNSRTTTPNPTNRQNAQDNAPPAPVVDNNDNRQVANGHYSAPQQRSNRDNGPPSNPNPRYSNAPNRPRPNQQQQRPRQQGQGRHAEPRNNNRRQPTQVQWQGRGQQNQGNRQQQQQHAPRQNLPNINNGGQGQNNGPPISNSTQNLLAALTVLKDYMG